MINIKVTLPKKKFAQKKWLKSIASKQRAKSLPALRNLFKQTVFGWSNKPDFGWAQRITADEIVLHVYPTGPYADVWNMLNEGSPPHPISAKNGGLLTYKKGYRASTRPGSLQSQRNYRSGPIRRPASVNHPGFKARKFTELIAQEFAEKFGIEMQEAVSEVANR